MTAREILDRAMRLLGYTDGLGNPEMSGRINSRAISAINSVYSDLFYLNKEKGFQAIKDLKDEIFLPERVLNDVMPYGVAGFIAQGESDGDQQQLFMAIYNKKRLGAVRPSNIKDVLPSVL